MNLRILIERIGATYDRGLKLEGEAQRLLRSAPSLLTDCVPAGIKLDASGGKGAAAIVPWIAFMNPEETETPRRGMYVVYLFSADMKTVSLSLNQGVTELVREMGIREGRRKLAGQAAAIRDAFPSEELEGLQSAIMLRAEAALPARSDLPGDYEAGNIVAKTYDLSDLPSEDQMVADLSRFIELYSRALEMRQYLLVVEPNVVVTRSEIRKPERPVAFKPKNSTEYSQYIRAGVVRKSRSHELVLDQYGRFLMGREFVCNTNVHPRDLTAIRGDECWLIEVKIVYHHDGVQATRDALSQLLMYRDFLYCPDSGVGMLAVFSEDVGLLNTEFLERYGIASVWKSRALWVGSPMAQEAGLCIRER